MVEKENKPKKEKAVKATIADVLKAIVDLNNNLNLIAESIKKPEPSLSFRDAAHPALPETVVKKEEPVLSEYKFPIPPEFKEAVEANLNKKFGIDIEYKSETAAFAFSILVPREYSEASPAYWATHGEDRRTRVILNALGANGVRDWANTVFNSFSPETKSKIVFDRGQIN